jgi:hypothetical protein
MGASGTYGRCETHTHAVVGSWTHFLPDGNVATSHFVPQSLQFGFVQAVDAALVLLGLEQGALDLRIVATLLPRRMATCERVSMVRHRRTGMPVQAANYDCAASAVRPWRWSTVPANQSRRLRLPRVPVDEMTACADGCADWLVNGGFTTRPASPGRGAYV